MRLDTIEWALLHRSLCMENAELLRKPDKNYKLAYVHWEVIGWAEQPPLVLIGS